MATRNQVIEAVQNGLDRLIEKDKFLLVYDVNERSLSHHFANYLQMEVDRWGEEWQVDCEYNRDIAEGEYYSKKLNLTTNEIQAALKPDVEDEHASTVFPDVIIHRRGPTGHQGGNLLVVEMKKSTSTEKGNFDRYKKL